MKATAEPDDRPATAAASGRRGWSWLGWAWAAILAGVFLRLGIMLPEQTSGEAWVRDSAAWQLAQNTTEGRQALVSSVWWAPLPTLLRLPVAAAVHIEGLPLASLLVSTLCGAALVLILERLLGAWGMGLARYLFVAAWLLNPFFLQACVNGSSDTMIVLFAVMGFAGLAGWLAFGKMRHLMILAAGTAGLIGSDLIMGIWGLALLMVFMCHALFSRRFEGRERGSLLILGFLPAVYVLGLWVLANWLVMGDALYFLRSLRGEELGLGRMGDSLARFISGDVGRILDDTRRMGIGVGHRMGLLVAVLASIPALLRRRAGAFLPGIALSLLLGLGVTSGVHGVGWDSDRTLLAVSAVVVAALGFVAAGLDGVPRRFHLLAGLIPLALTAAALVQFISEGRGIVGTDEGGFQRRRAVIQEIERYALGRARHAKVFVAGYEGLEWFGGEPSPAFAHALDFNFNKVKTDYRGHSLFLLVRRPIGRSQTDSIHWQHPKIHAWGSRSTLHDNDWGDWRLFEIVQAPVR